MKPTFHCIPCHVNHSYRVVSKLNLSHDSSLRLMKELTRVSMDSFPTPPDCAYELYKTISQITGIQDPFCDEKKQSNALMLAFLPQLQVLCSGKQSIRQALRIAVAANSIDYGIGNQDCGNFSEQFKNIVDDIEVSDDFCNEFIQAISASHKILYIADNAGEIVADKLLMEHLPVEKIICVVRGNPVINDATIEDAHSIGLDKVVPVITTGDCTPGINLTRCGKDFLYELSQADMVILKGQGNFETMIDAPLEGIAKKGLKMFFIFKVKCLPVAQFLHKQLGDSAFIIREI
ncbi:MAG: ARMT1-like domain-containing protein [Spirochaetota bacterium]